MNFANFKPVQSANTREGVHFTKGQSFNFKYKKFHSKKNKVDSIQSAFTISNDLFDKLGLAGLRGLLEIVSPEGQSYLAVVDNDNALFLKTNKKNENGKKGKGFKSTVLEGALAKQGIINLDLIGTTQKLDLNLVEGSESAVIGIGEGAIQSYGVYEVAKAANADLTDEEKAEDAAGTAEDDEDATPVDSTPAAGDVPAIQEAAPVASATAPAEDDF